MLLLSSKLKPYYVSSVTKVIINLFSTKEGPLKFPVPQLNNTLNTYLKYIKPLVSQEECTHTEKLLNDFVKNGEGEKLQNLLQEKANSTENWLSDWWTNITYLEGREPIVVNSNPGLRLPTQTFKNSDEWLKFSVDYLRGFLKYKVLIDTNNLPQDYQKKEPLCMEQYYTLFSSCRIPGRRLDSIFTAASHTLPASLRPDFITVVHKNRFFTMQVFDPENGKMCSKEAMLRGFMKILEISRSKGQPLGLMTAENRNIWGTAYYRLQEIAINRQSFFTIHQSILLFCLDSPIVAEAESPALDHIVAKNMLHGNGHKVNSANRWFDKTIQLIVSRDGACGVNYEHTPAEAPPIITMIEDSFLNIGKDSDSSSISTKDACSIDEIEFTLDHSTREDIDIAKANINSLVKDLELVSIHFNRFGKKQIKALKISPDAFVQMGIQLGYYMMHNHPGSTYESGSLRRYKLGRTDTIRSCSPEAVMFCEAMMDSSCSNNQRRDKLMQALNQHVAYSKQVMNAQGIDRHLLGLKLTAVENSLDIPDIFMDTSFSKATHYMLITSAGSSKVNMTMCYGPLVPDGYGFSYNITGNAILGCISAVYSSPTTDASKLANSIETAWVEIMELLQQQ